MKDAERRKRYLPADGTTPLFATAPTSTEDVALHAHACAAWLAAGLKEFRVSAAEAAAIILKMGCLGAAVTIELAPMVPPPVLDKLREQIHAAANRPRLCNARNWEAFYGLARAQMAKKR
jgi:hypothetical protein